MALRLEGSRSEYSAPIIRQSHMFINHNTEEWSEFSRLTPQRIYFQHDRGSVGLKGIMGIDIDNSVREENEDRICLHVDDETFKLF